LLRFLPGESAPVKVKDAIDFGKVGLLGAGNLGSAVGYVLSLSGWAGQLHIIDFQAFEKANLETCISAHVQEVRVPLRKASALAGIFVDHRIVATERRCEVKRGEPLLGEKWDSFICAVDNPETRLILDEVNAGFLINAGLGANRYDAGWVFLTQHGPDHPTLSSIYKESTSEAGISDYVPEEFRDECSRMSYQGVSLALPFAGLAAGSLLVAGLYHQATGSRTKFSSIRMDLFAKQQKLTRL